MECFIRTQIITQIMFNERFLHFEINFIKFLYIIKHSFYIGVIKVYMFTKRFIYYFPM